MSQAPAGTDMMLMKLDDFERAQGVAVMVDTIIFEDGRVLGPDEAHLVDYINSIAGAVKALVLNLRDAMSAGRNVDDILTNIVSTKRTRSVDDLRDDPGGFWTLREATLLLRLPLDQRMQRLNALERVPAPPAFYR
jgi:hypothetical protein